MNCSIFAILCGVLTLIHPGEYGENMENCITPSQPSKPLPFSSVVYLADGRYKNWIFCVGVLISSEYVLADEFCNENIRTIAPCLTQNLRGPDLRNCLAQKTKIWFGKISNIVEKSYFRHIMNVKYENKVPPKLGHKGLLIAELNREAEQSMHVSIAYLPGTHHYIGYENTATVEVDKAGEFKIVEMSIDFTWKYEIKAVKYVNSTNIKYSVVGSPLFQGYNLIGIAGLKATVLKDKGIFFKRLQVNYDFIEEFVAYGDEYLVDYYDPGKSV